MKRKRLRATKMPKILVVLVQITILLMAFMNLVLISKDIFHGNNSEAVMENNLPINLPNSRKSLSLRNLSEMIPASIASKEDEQLVQEVREMSVERPIEEDLAADILPSHTKFNVIGMQRQKTGFLTIGIPSVKRPKDAVYLTGTLDSLIKTTTTAEKDNLVIVVFLCDNEPDYNDQLAAQLRSQYSSYIATGFVQLLRVAKEFYPPLQGLKRNFNDSSERVSWRAKQVVDFSFMFLYARNISQYYLQIEDDVTCAKDFVSSITKFIREADKAVLSKKNKLKRPWALLEFSELGFIGKLVRSADLTKFSQFLRIFYEEQPVDWLMWYFRMSMGQTDQLLRKPTLFQHSGTQSSLHDKKNKLRDKFFQDEPRQQHAITGTYQSNPPAQVFSTMLQFKNYAPLMAYDGRRDTDYFWARFPRAKDTVTVVFDEPQLLDGVAVETGLNINSLSDILLNGTLHASPVPSLKKLGANCSDYTPIAKFQQGQAEAVGVSANLSDTPIACLKIVVDESQDSWIIFRRIRVRAEGKPPPLVAAPVDDILHNPPARIFCSMLPFKRNGPEVAYAKSVDTQFFWAKSPMIEDRFTVVFKEPQLLESVFVQTGMERDSTTDILLKGTLEVSPKISKLTQSKVVCSDYITIAHFEQGNALAANLQDVLQDMAISCLRIVVGESQTDWIIFKQIQVEVRSTKKPSLDTDDLEKSVERVREQPGLSRGLLNPPARVFSSMSYFGSNTPELAYIQSKESDYFWARLPQEGDTLTIVFNEPQLLEYVAVKTGKTDRGRITDVLREGTLEVSSTLLESSQSSPACSDYITLAQFEQGKAQAPDLQGILHDTPISCLRVMIGKTQKSWIIFSQIIVKVKQTSQDILQEDQFESDAHNFLQQG